MDHSFDSAALNNGDNHENATSNNDHGWQKVTYAKRHRNKQKQNASDVVAQNGGGSGKETSVFRSLEEAAEDRRRRIAAANMAAVEAEEGGGEKTKKKRWGDEETSDDEDEEREGENGGGEVQKVKKAKKIKKPKVTVAEAAAKIDPDFFEVFLAEISTSSYEGKQDIQLMRFADYFGRAFSGVTGAQFPWMKLFRESNVAKLADIPLSHISDAVYKMSVDWINQRSVEALGSFIIWCSESIFADLAGQQAVSKGAKKNAQQPSSKSQVAIFVVLAMVLRRKPDALLNVLSTLRDSKYHGQDKLPVHIWMITQASQGDLAVGLYAWAHNLLPLVNGKSFNPQSRDLVLQLVERILSAQKARTILKSNAVRKGDRLIPPAAFETLMRVTFPAPSARIKATERFEAIYPVLKEVALGGDPKSKAMKQVLQQIMNFALKAAGEGNPELSKEATAVFVWCLTQNVDCYKHWDKLYEDHLVASVAILKKLAEEWKQHSPNQSDLMLIRDTVKNFRLKNEKALPNGEGAAQHSLYKDADKHCKVILGRLSRGNGCIKGLAVAVIGIAVCAAVMSQDMESWDLNKIADFINSHVSF